MIYGTTMNENLIVNLEGRKVVTATFRKLSKSKKDKIYNAIIGAFGGDAFARVSLDSIADTAGIAKGSLVQYFTEKENLAVFAAEILFDDFQAFWEKHFAVDYSGRVRDKIIKFMSGEVRYWFENKAVALFYIKMTYEHGAGFEKSFRDGFHELRLDHLHDILHSGIETRQISPNADIDAAAELLASFQGDVVYQAITEEKKKSVDFYEMMIKRSVELVIGGLD